MNINLLDWDKVPKEYKWIAEDNNGECYAFIEKPIRYTSWWGCGRQHVGLSVRLQYIECNSSNGDWIKSLTMRPNPKEELSTIDPIGTYTSVPFYSIAQIEEFFVSLNEGIKITHLDDFIINNYRKEERAAVKLLMGLGYSVTK